MSSTTLLLLTGSSVLLLGAFALLFRRLASAGPPVVTDEELDRRFSAADYRPMERLLDEYDYQFLSAQAGYHPRIARNLRKQRVRIFRAYLKALGRDFEALHREARIRLRDAAEDRPDLAIALARQSARFRYGMFAARISVAGYQLGLRPGDVTGLIRSTQWLHEQVRLLSGEPLAAGSAG